MPQEIERKFLVTSDSWRQQVTRQARYLQGYINEPGTCSVRIRIDGDRADLNIKSATLGIQRLEFEYQIPLEDGQLMLEQLSMGPTIRKVRYFVPQGKHTWEIDVFEGENIGLVVAEIELDSEAEAFDRPAWLGEEVSHDPRYYNVQLMRRPFSTW